MDSGVTTPPPDGPKRPLTICRHRWYREDINSQFADRVERLLLFLPPLSCILDAL